MEKSDVASQGRLCCRVVETAEKEEDGRKKQDLLSTPALQLSEVPVQTAQEYYIEQINSDSLRSLWNRLQRLSLRETLTTEGIGLLPHKKVGKEHDNRLVVGDQH